MKEKINTKVLALLVITFGLLFLLPTVNAAVTLTSPVTLNNYTTLTFTCTKLVADVPINATQMAVFYNASGGNAGTGASRLGTVVANDSSDDLSFSGTFGGIESLTDGASYNFTCVLGNATVNVTSAGVKSVTIDNLAPTGSFIIAKPTISTGNVQDLSWTSADATSGLATVLFTITSPDSARCAAYTSSSAISSVQRLGTGQTDCEGTYTVSLAVTDLAGNTYSPTDGTFKTTMAGSASGGSTGSSSGVSTGTFSIFSDKEGKGGISINAIVVIAVIILLLWHFNKKK